jgi:hypothetical protein
LLDVAFGSPAGQAEEVEDVWVFGELLREFGVGRGEPAGRTVDGTNK